MVRRYHCTITADPFILLSPQSRLARDAHNHPLTLDFHSDDLIEVLERDGATIVDDFVSDLWLAEFNTAIQTSIDEYKPYN